MQDSPQILRQMGCLFAARGADVPIVIPAQFPDEFVGKKNLKFFQLPGKLPTTGLLLEKRVYKLHSPFPECKKETFFF
ncbi:MAG: hypothetical protein QM796_20565 [Chthoniobacteraceae bacterium]